MTIVLLVHQLVLHLNHLGPALALDVGWRRSEKWPKGWVLAHAIGAMPGDPWLNCNGTDHSYIYIYI